MGARIRAAGLGDIERLALLGQATFLESYADVLLGTDILSHCATQHAPSVYEDWLLDGSTRIWLAEQVPGLAPVGYIVMTQPDIPIEDLDLRDVEIRRVYVLHRFQGAGIGRRLIEMALAGAARTGRKRLLLGVNIDNHAAIGFYRRLGFTQISTRKFRVGESLHDDLVLAKAVG